MDSLFVQCLSNKLICSICKDYFTDPVTIICGHSFCTPCLCLLWENTQTPTYCPVCRTIAPRMDFKSTLFVKRQVRLPGKSVVCQFPSSAKQICKTHQAIKHLFCHMDRSLLCSFCSHSPGHATHRHCPAKQAAQHYRVSNDSECTLKGGQSRYLLGKRKNTRIIIIILFCNKHIEFLNTMCQALF